MTTAMTQMSRMTTVAASQVTVIGTGFATLDRTTRVLSGLPNLRQPKPGPCNRLSTARSGWHDTDRDCNDRPSLRKRPESSQPYERPSLETVR